MVNYSDTRSSKIRSLPTFGLRLSCTAWTFLTILAGFKVEGHGVHRRNVIQMCNMVNYYTERTCLEFDRYGCFCGYGQEGRKPLDDVDECCKVHDDCYGEVHCSIWSGLVVGYQYDCSQLSRECECSDKDLCANSVCQCDLKFSECLQRAKYNHSYKGYDKRLCN
ncbi:hypothetical protein ACJMK2_028770 [Sinanodonta woodiana]|uniref:Phospholipase A2 n=1 Tax=Sinanodonta woodiana TaxID=1069815 RepID=A0ABD3XA34_SINWO